MHKKLLPLTLLAASLAFSDEYSGTVTEVVRAAPGCANYGVLKVQNSQGSTHAFRITKDDPNFKDVLAMALTAMAGGFQATAIYNQDSYACGTYYYLSGFKVNSP